MQVSTQTTITGAALGAAIGSIIIYLIGLLAHVDVPPAIQGSVIVVVTALVALVYPA